MRQHIKTCRIFLLSFFAVVALCGCDQSEERFKSYSIGFTTQGQEVSVDAAHIDNLWAVPGGVSIAGVWGEAAGGAGVFDKPMPHQIRINWLDKKTNKRYDATVTLVDDLAKRAKMLPGYIYLPTQRKNTGAIYLIIGLALEGKVTIWLSNTTSGKYREGRVLEIIGEAQGSQTQEVLPYYPTNKRNAESTGVMP